MSDDLKNLTIQIRNIENDINALGWRMNKAELKIAQVDDAVKVSVLTKIKQFFGG
jgi:predicted  nucleic acid-binding Zn-ribbon protein